MKIPQQILIEIINQKNEVLEIEISFGLKIYQKDGSYHNFSVIKTDSNGKRLILQDEIINNTELKHINDIENFECEKIEFYISECESINSILDNLKSTENLLKKENVNQILLGELIARGFTEENANIYIQPTKEKLENDMKIFSYLKDVKNCNTKFKVELIVDKWVDNSNKKYKFIVES